MKRILKIVLPIVVIGFAAGAAKIIIDSKVLPTPEPREIVRPIVSTMLAEKTDWRVVVPSQGTVVPRTESSLVAEVGGRATFVSPHLINGGFFEAGELLVEIDASDYQLAVAQAELEVARAERRLAEERADAAVAEREWKQLGEGAATPLTLREPQVAEAEANLSAAQALEARALRDLERTRVVAPFAGRVRHESIEQGQYVNPRTSIATVYATDIAEVRLPLPDEELAFLDLQLTAIAGAPSEQARVKLSAIFAGERRTWNARIVRTEGEIDPMTRMVMAVASVEDPYGLASADDVPLALGMFVSADIQGKLLENVYVLPRTALRDGRRIFLLDEDDRLKYANIEILRSERDSVVVRGDIPEGTRVVISPLEIATDGMRVRDLGNDVDLGAPAKMPASQPNATLEKKP